MNIRWISVAMAAGAALYFGVAGYLDHYCLGYVLAGKWIIIAAVCVLWAASKPRKRRADQ